MVRGTWGRTLPSKRANSPVHLSVLAGRGSQVLWVRSRVCLGGDKLPWWLWVLQLVTAPGAGHGVTEAEHMPFSFPPLLLPSRSQCWGLLLAQNVRKAS